MANKTSVIMETVDQLKNKSTRSITNINPSASTTELKNFAEGLNGLTTNTVADIRRVETTDILNDTRLPHNLQVAAGSSLTVSSATVSHDATNPTTIDFTGVGLSDENLYLRTKVNDDGAMPYSSATTNEGTELFLFIVNGTGDNSLTSGCEIEIYIPGNADYQAESVTITFVE